MSVDWSKVPIPQSYADLYAHYGDPSHADFEATYIVSNPHYLKDGTLVHVRSHIAAVPALHAIWAVSQHWIETYDGCYVVRNVRGMSAPSIHSWGLAIDLNAGSNELGTPGSQPVVLIKAFADHGWFWGGQYHHRKDPMHFQRAGDF